MAAADEAGSSEMSSPPSGPDTIAVRQAQPQPTRFLVPGDVVNNNISLPQDAKGVASNAKPSTTASHDAPPAPKRRTTKKKEVAENKDENVKPKEKKTRKPRTVDPNKPPASRKKQKTSDAATAEPAQPRQLAIAEMVNKLPTQMAAPATANSKQLLPEQIMREDLSSTVTPPPVKYIHGYPTFPAYDQPRMKYDPVRGPHTQPQDVPVMLPQIAPHKHKASASPAISSLMNPTVSLPSNHMASPAPSMQTPLQTPNIPAAASPPSQRMQVTEIPAPTKPVPSMLSPMDLSAPSDTVAKEEDSQPKMQEVKEKEKEKAMVKSAPAAAKAKRPSPPPTGSGLLSKGNLFGGPATGEDDRTRHGVDIDIRIALNPAGNNTINIAQEIMKKYGRDAINPRAAAHRERLLQVANMATRLENGSADDMSIDNDNSDAENDSNVEMGGMEDEKKGEAGDGEKPTRRRKKKVEEYDKDDDFIDDAELAWQEGAAVAKDGFFVYSGPLIPVGEEAKIETSVPSGRGRGRGRGRARGTTGSGGVTHAQLAAKNDATVAGAASSGRGRGRGRGTGAPRKPRITKADRERMEIEKMDRAKAGGALVDGKAFLTPQNV